MPGRAAFGCAKYVFALLTQEGVTLTGLSLKFKLTQYPCAVDLENRGR
jgi:hypothetical protein